MPCQGSSSPAANEPSAICENSYDAEVARSSSLSSGGSTPATEANTLPDESAGAAGDFVRLRGRVVLEDQHKSEPDKDNHVRDHLGPEAGDR